MPKLATKLTTATLKSNLPTGRYADGNGLSLNVTKAGSKNWVLRYSFGGKQKEMGLGSARIVGLAEARKKAIDIQQRVLAGIDPMRAKREAARAEARSIAPVVTFKEHAERYIGGREHGWSSVSTAQWKSNMDMYIYPTIGHLPVTDITTDHVTRLLAPIWMTKIETARRVRSRVERIIAVGFAAGDHTDAVNPARYHNHIELLMPEQKRDVVHHASMPYQDIPHFMVELAAVNTRAARALEWLILTGTRTSETLGATHSEIDVGNLLWSIPAKRMKMKQDHRVPLSPQLIARLPEPFKGEPNLFPGHAGNALSNMAMAMQLRKLDLGHLTVHGFRSSIRDWMAEETKAPHEIAERVLAHVTGGAVVAAYRRTDYLEQRRELMAGWAAHCCSELDRHALSIVRSA